MSSTNTSVEELARAIRGRVVDAGARVEFLEEALTGVEAAAHRAEAAAQAATVRERRARAQLEAATVRERDTRRELEEVRRTTRDHLAAERQRIAQERRDALSQAHRDAAKVVADARRAAAAMPPPVPRLALNKTDAAAALGVSVDFFDDHVAHDLACVRRGRRRLYPMKELDRWLEQSAERVSIRHQ
jgi:hypothetical protein